MKALTLTQPWASLVVDDVKRYETRSWATRYRGPLLIHAARRFHTPADRQVAEYAGLDLDRLPHSAVIGIVRLVDVITTEEARMAVGIGQAALGDFSPGRFAWRLEEPVTFAEPITWPGRLGLWTFPDELVPDA